MCETPTTLLEAARYFADVQISEDYMREIRWPKGEPVCPACQSKRIGEVATRRLLRCKDCRKQFSHKVGTIFEDSPLGLDKWFVAVWAVANCKNGISSHELGRAIGVTQKTAWFMNHRIRKAMETDTFQKFDGPAEADTTYVGGLAANMHKSKREKKIKGRGDPKPRGWSAFNSLARQLAAVPKDEVDKVIAATPKRKRRKPKK